MGTKPTKSDRPYNWREGLLNLSHNKMSTEAYLLFLIGAALAEISGQLADIQEVANDHWNREHNR